MTMCPVHTVLSHMNRLWEGNRQHKTVCYICYELDMKFSQYILHIHPAESPLDFSAIVFSMTLTKSSSVTSTASRAGKIPLARKTSFHSVS